MSDELKDLETLTVSAPTLTFGTPESAPDLPAAAPSGTAAADTISQEAQKILDSGETPQIDTSMLTAEELKQVDDFSKQIDVTDSAAVLNYGVGAQKKLADFSEKTLTSVRTKDMGEVGGMITDLVTELKGFDVDDEKGFFGFFKKTANKATALKTRYDSVEKNVNKITSELEKHQVILLKDIDLLDRMYDLNLAYFKELTMYILAGKKRLEEVRATDLVELQNKAAQSGLAEDAQAARDLAEKCDRFEKKLYDLELTRTVALQSGPQIRMVQSSDTVMAEKIQSTIVNTIPLWKNQMVIALGVEHATQAAKVEREVNDMTNELLRKNADKLKVATIEAAKEAERGIVDIETLKHTNAQLISTLDEVVKIQEDGKEKRRAAEAELVVIEKELKDKLMEASRK